MMDALGFDDLMKPDPFGESSLFYPETGSHLETPKLSLEDICEFELPLCYEPPSPAFSKPCISSNISVPEMIPSVYNYIPFGSSPSDFPEPTSELESDPESSEKHPETSENYPESIEKHLDPTEKYLDLMDPEWTLSEKLSKLTDLKSSNPSESSVDQKITKKPLILFDLFENISETPAKPFKTHSIYHENHLNAFKKPFPVLPPLDHVEKQVLPKKRDIRKRIQIIDPTTENLEHIQTVNAEMIQSENLEHIQTANVEKIVSEDLEHIQTVKKTIQTSNHFKRPAKDLDKPNYFKKISKMLKKSEHFQKNIETSFEKLSLAPLVDKQFRKKMKSYKIPKRMVRYDEDVLILHPDPEDYDYIFNR